MKRFITFALICLAGLSLIGCAQYERNYGHYAQAWTALASNPQPIIKVGVDPTGKVTGIEMGNFAIAMAMMSGFQKPTSEGVEMFKSFMGIAPYAALFGVATIGMQNAGQGNMNANIVGDGNVANSKAGTSIQTTPSSVTNTDVTVPIEAAGIME